MAPATLNGKNQHLKSKRRLLDAINPDRKRIRRMQRKGILPEYKIERTRLKSGLIQWRLKSVFQLLTAEDTKKALNPSAESIAETAKELIKERTK